MRSGVPLALLLAALMTVLPVSGYPTPGLNGGTTEAVPVIGRLFPEPLMTNDYIGYFEAVASLESLDERFPDRIELIQVGESYGWVNVQTQDREPNAVYTVEVTNELSTVPFADKIHLVFTCSIHGNEKGGREGCLRVIEDFAKGIGMASQDRIALLDYMVLSFTVPNSDGWTHDEPQYFPSSPGAMYTRENANGTDLNRQWPSLGFIEDTSNHNTMAEPEIAAVAPFLKQRYPNVWYAADIHGMLQPADGETPPPPTCAGADPTACGAYPTEFQEYLAEGEHGHFLLGLLPQAQLTQDEFIRLTQFAELVRERTSTCPGTLGPTWCNAPSMGAWGGGFNFWGTSWETIGYEASGSTRNYMMSPFGLNAPSATYEMSYNHIVCDGVYTGCGAYMNEFHVNTVRAIVGAFMEAAQKDLRVSLETGGMRVGYLFNPRITTTADASGNPRGSGGWSDESAVDDGWDILHNVYAGGSNDYLRNVALYVRDGDKPGVLNEVTASRIDMATLADYDTFVVGGSAWEQLDEARIGTLGEWVRQGGTLVLTDESLKVLTGLGIAPAESIRIVNQYVGWTDVLDYSHPLAADLIGYSRQTYDPVPIGIPQGSAPNWVIDTSTVEAAGGQIVGVIPEGAPLGGGSPNTNLGEIPLGSGKIRFLGALLPDPLVEHYTPYGIGSYGVTYAGNQFFLNLVGFTQVFEAPPLVLSESGSLQKVSGREPAAEEGPAAAPDGDQAGGRSPGPGVLLAALGLAAAVAVRRMRRT